jgi:hypothetical protein
MREFIEKKQNECGATLAEILETNGFEEEWVPKIVDAFKAHGINVPFGAHFVYTGDEDDRPARCETQADDFVLGWGLSSPWHWHESIGVESWDETFRKVADIHTWVWMG